MNINTLDLNLLRVFDALYRERNVSRAGERIGLAQSSMSNALNRLREQLDDPLFQRTPGGMEPTERAEQLAPGIQQVLQQLHSLLAPQVFDPATASGRIRIAAADLTVMSLAAPLMGRLSKQAPGMQLSFLPLEKASVFRQLDDRLIDLAIGNFSRVPAHLRRKTLSHEQFIVIARRQHPALQQRLTLEQYCRLPHALMTLNQDQTGIIDSHLKKRGLQRFIAMTCAHFAPLADVVGQTDLIATVPQSLLATAERAGCCSYPLPLPLDSWPLELVCTQGFYGANAGRFVTDMLMQVARQHG
ncbi:LysR family transcriptional regulator [Oceanimonas sp. MB9]|uniref:LysR family transcriptional regulator n=1 Tax=Oceanimonas sp. MB9 TaxID=2588453 RepID=UPI0013F6566F|nr:LysR family transcriptional regulator [Oceanimonas sp. MB9]NHI00253.1 PCP degradation transcriptional activation protein [Oceanimonas sp. MB9]